MLSSWGQTNAEIEIRAKRRYQHLLRNSATIGEGIFFGLLSLACIGLIWMLTAMNFENAVFYDGTAMVCVMDGDTGEITNVR